MGKAGEGSWSPFARRSAGRECSESRRWKFTTDHRGGPPQPGALAVSLFTPSLSESVERAEADGCPPALQGGGQRPPGLDRKSENREKGETRSVERLRDRMVPGDVAVVPV
ncbi:MAG: hypothetical protein D8M18_11185, partial [Bacteroidetes bacterium]|nr:hypothetical protein [Bacteroidota bacterium]